MGKGRIEHLEPEEVCALAIEHYDRYDYPHMEDGDVRMVVQLIESLGIRFYRETGLIYE